MIAVLALVCIAIMPAPAVAGKDIALNKVWSRLADLYGEYGSVESAEFSPDSQYIVTGTKYDYTVRMFSTVDGDEIWRRTLPQEIEQVIWTPDGKYVASGSEDRMFRVFDAKTGDIVFEYDNQDGVDALAASHDGRYILVGQERGADRTGPVRIFSTEDWRLVRTIRHQETVEGLDLTSDDKFFVTSGFDYVRIWRTETGKLVRTFNMPEDPESREDIFVGATFSPDDRYLAAGAKNGYLYIWDVKSGERLRRLNLWGRKIETIAWTPDGRYLGLAGHMATIDFFAVEDLLNDDIGNDVMPFALQVPVTDNLEHMSFNESGALLTTAHQDGTVQLWTYMSDDPTLNQRLFDELFEEQRKQFE